MTPNFFQGKTKPTTLHTPPPVPDLDISSKESSSKRSISQNILEKEAFTELQFG